jgi:hypothetical protein
MLRTALNRLALTLAIVVPTAAVAIEPTMKLSIEHPDRPILHGITNLPDGAELLLTLTKVGGGYVGQSKATVAAGQFATGAFSKEGAQLPVGRYNIEVSMSIAPLQPPRVQAVIGSHGEKLSGRFVSQALGEPVFDYTERRELGGPG